MKPECSEYQAKIGRFLLGDLTQKEQEALETHLVACPQCQSEQESYTRTLNLVQSVDNEPVPRHFFIQPEERALNLWELFRMLKPRWQAHHRPLCRIVPPGRHRGSHGLHPRQH